MHALTLTRRFALASVAVLTIAACSGGGDDDTATTEATAEEPATTDGAAGAEDDPTAAGSDPGDDDADDAGTAAGETEGDEPTEAAGSFEEGDVRFRSVNLLDRPVDIYVRTTGLVEAFPVEAGVAPGAVTEYAAPPPDGNYVVTEAGAGDPTCVVDCDHFVANLSGAFGEGPTRLVLLYDDEFSGASAFDLSEEPDSVESASASANLLRPADPTTGLVFPVGIALDPEVFGFRVGFTGVDGCVEALDQENILVGGNQTPAYPYPGDGTDLLLFEQPDQDCEAPVASFAIDGGPGTRTLVALQGGVEPVTGIVVELAGSDGGGDGETTGNADGETTGNAGSSDAAPTDRDEFVQQLLGDAPPGTDEQCVVDVIDQISDADLQIIIDNFDADDVPPELSPEALETLSGILECAPA